MFLNITKAIFFMCDFIIIFNIYNSTQKII